MTESDAWPNPQAPDGVMDREAIENAAFAEGMRRAVEKLKRRARGVAAIPRGTRKDAAWIAELVTERTVPEAQSGADMI